MVFWLHIRKWLLIGVLGTGPQDFKEPHADEGAKQFCHDVGNAKPLNFLNCDPGDLEAEAFSYIKARHITVEP